MKDIRVNKKRVTCNRFSLLFYKINFKFFSVILEKYSGNKYVDSLISQRIPLTFLLNSVENESILKSISEIIDILKKQRKEKEESEDSAIEEKGNVEKITNININRSYRSSYSTVNNFDSPSLTFRNSKNNTEVINALESLVVNIKKNLKSKKNIYNQKISNVEKVGDKSLQDQAKVDPGEGVSKSKDEKYENYIEEKKINKESNSNPLDLKDEKIHKSSEKIINKIELKKITNKFRKINEDIIQKKINSIRISKINYDFISKNKTLGKSIYNRVNETLSSIITKNNKYRYFSEFSKNVISLNKKIRTKNEINNLNKLIDLSKKIKQRNMLERSYVSRVDRSFADNFYYYSDKTDSKKIVKSVTLFNDLISKTKTSFSKSKEFLKNSLDLKKLFFVLEIKSLNNVTDLTIFSELVLSE